MTETTFLNYQERASRTMASKEGRGADGAHMALGFTSELGEMYKGIENNDLENTREEHGDTLWYVANECNIYGFIFSDLYIQAINSVPLSFDLHNIVDLHKREWIYGKVMDKRLLHIELQALMQHLVEIAYLRGFDFEESLKINIAKLYKRYPDKYSHEDALNRDLDAEAEILKG